MTIATQNTTVRPAAAEDWPHVVRLLEAYGLAADDLRQPHAGYLLAWAEGEAIGVAGAEPYGDAALIRAVAVDKPHQGTGVGKRLVDRLLADLRQGGIVRAYLFTVTTPEYFAQFKFRRMAHEQAPSALRASPEFQRACSTCTALMSLALAEEGRPGFDQTAAQVSSQQPSQQPAQRPSQQAAAQASSCCAPAPAAAAGKSACCGPASTVTSEPGRNKCCG